MKSVGIPILLLALPLGSQFWIFSFIEFYFEFSGYYRYTAQNILVYDTKNISVHDALISIQSGGNNRLLGIYINSYYLR